MRYFVFILLVLVCGCTLKVEKFSEAQVPYLVPGSVPPIACPSDAVDRCETWYGTEMSSVVCTDASVSLLPGCLSTNLAVSPTIWCCPRVAETWPDGSEDGLPACEETPCDSDQTPTCSNWYATDSVSVAHCVKGNGYDCIPKWSHCGTFSSDLLCCSD